MQHGSAGVLIIHGFTATRDSVLPLVDPLESMGLRVSLPVLTGHGGVSPELLRGVKWQDWMKDVEKAFFELEASVDKVFLVGHSMGALLALNLAAKFQDRLEAVIAAAPAIHLVSLLAPERPLHALAPLLQRFIRNWDLKVAFSDPDVQSADLHYPWAPTDAIMSFFDLISFTASRLHDIRCPLFIIHNRHEKTVTADSAEIVYNGVSTPEDEKQLVWLERSEHQMFCDCEKERVIELIISYIRQRLVQ
ncbi:alpha/beta fold hydrolase [Prosthecochloris sp. N3]|uniref:Alpha/beta fold hydrolase n=1 Tax=Prosthecochloris ethylica TaxID=2743976 RepID=A0ABR9XTL8_9CHLB|nr:MULTISPECIES: alpha/beta fold hydrolase [Prosthecochloris]MBF0587094.1 alpha/beta fold hydrolase [Prosthecochloris ethylica]MBF0637208.1 alpha/beta fold hydrolase [Prosthecochloris ethylica]NUK48247.1 alpha/beta fold hydrolase [Prosthecochloris ethylica]RNA65648.1 alpha/beta fold hydrolase [Prosthecochloris sp. ZM_2]